MKIIHCADVHLDSKINGLPTDKSKLVREENIRAFEKTCAFACENDVNAVIIAGDMFDGKKVYDKTKKRVLNAISRASEVTFFYLSGNHDEDSFIDNETVYPDNLKIFTDEWTSYSIENVVISGIKLTNANSFSFYDTLNLDGDKINVVTLHGQVAGYKSNVNADIISIPRLKDKNIDYLALGHIHYSDVKQLDDRGLYAYSGCLSGRGFDELGEKGFNLIEVNDKKLSVSFIKISVYDFYDFEFDVTDRTSWYDTVNEILDVLSKKYASTSLIKVILKGEHNLELDIDKDMLKKQLDEKFFFSKVYDKTTLKVSEEDYALDKSICGEFVRAVWESKLSPEKKAQIIRLGLNAIKGEEL